MKITKTINFKVDWTFRDSGLDDMSLIDKLDKDIRKSVAKIFSDYAYILEDKKFLVNANLKNFFDREAELIQLLKNYEKSLNIRDDLHLNTLSVAISCDENSPRISSVAERYVYDLFLFMNLAVPGSCNFYRLTQEGSNYFRIQRYNLSGFTFGFPLFSCDNGNYAKTKVLDLQQVLNWYLDLNIGVKSLANKPIERVLFSMLRVAENSDDPASLVWIFNAIESLYSSGGGSSQSVLSKRISQFLEVEKSDLPRFKKSFKRLCDLRNSLFHSGFDVIHPVQVSGAHQQAEDLMGRYFELSAFGFQLILVSVQKLIELNWQGLKFTETFEGST